MQLSAVVDASARIGATRARTAKIAILAELLGAERTILPIVVPWLAGDLRQGRIGVGYAAVHGLRAIPPALDPTLTVSEVDAAFTAIGGQSGPGSATRRTELLRALFGRASPAEQAFLGSLLTAELRQGALAGLLAEAVARAAGVPAAAVRRATMLGGDLVAPCLTAFESGEPGLRAFDLELFRPVQPMLADTAERVEDALASLGAARFEQKLDGARVQVHRSGERIRVYTRALLDVTDAVPEVVELARSLPVDDLVLDGEVLAIDPAGRPLPFQTTMRRFGRKTAVADTRAAIPLHTAFFDVLRAGGTVLVDEPLRARVARLEALVPAAHRVRALDTADPAEAGAFLDAVLAEGHEGVMAKDPASPYEAGHRGARWLKLKPAWTLDLVVLAAEWGSGRRRGTLSNLHLGARDPRGGWVMLGKTFKGLTDEVLAWQTKELLARELRRDGHVVIVRPELVAEITFQDVQGSPRYPGGVALRLARVERYRPDKRPEDADTIDRVRDIFRGVARKTR
jgi:DNA ligase-1